MNYRPMLIANGVLIASMAGLSAWAWNQIPDGAQIPVHWNLEGHIDRFASKSEALVFFPALTLLITAMMWTLPRFDPRRANLEASGKFWNAATILLGLFLAYLHVLITLGALGQSVDMANALIPGLCVLIAGLGNYLGKTRSNWFGGVRTPWTLSSEYAWEKTHRVTGRLFVLSGLVTMIAWFVLGAKLSLFVLIGSVLVSVTAAVALSYFYWRIDPARRLESH
ncbi:MAG: SdpI family protein [Alphaproteobacteria bacterium]|nr:SdpI family protein [Alphaproteobacteria bacterium]